MACIIKSQWLQSLTQIKWGRSKRVYMGPLDLINHLLNFLVTALVVGTLVAVTGHFFRRKMAVARTLRAQAAINCVAGVLALGIGFWFFGRDGKMLSYTAMVLAIGSSQWFGAGFKS
jgi:hypothetical protein